jgi:hypothetical protein
VGGVEIRGGEILKLTKICTSCLALEEECEGPRWFYHAGAGGLFTFCDFAKAEVIEQTMADPSLEPMSEYNPQTRKWFLPEGQTWWFEDIEKIGDDKIC